MDSTKHQFKHPTVRIEENISLKPFNTFGLSVSASRFAFIKEIPDLYEALNHVQGKGESLFILGGGSNILLLGDVSKLVLKIDLRGIELLEEDQDSVVVKVGAGVIWHDFVMYAVERGWGGIENLALIPGTVGASPIQNIGAYGVEIKETFVELEAINISSGVTKIFNRSECRFGYRYSIFKGEEKGRWIITSVTFRLRKHGLVDTSYGDLRQVLEAQGITDPTIRDVSRAVIQIRQQKLPDPALIGNAGSFFKNPEIPQSHYHSLKEKYGTIPGYLMGNLVKVPAGWLIEKAGWKGYREGSVGVHDRQALVLVNYGGGKGAEIKQLAERIQASVEAKFGILLSPEVNYL